MNNPIPNNKPFPKGVSGNPNGRPPKLVSKINADLKKEGYKPLSPSQIKDSYLILGTLNEDRIKELVSDKDTPMFIRIIARRVIGKDGFEVFEKLLDRTLGKPKQSYDHTTKGEKINNQIDLKLLTDEELEILERIKERGSQGGEV